MYSCYNNALLFDDVLLQISVLLHTHIQDECYYYESMGHRFFAILSRGVHDGRSCAGGRNMYRE